MESRVDEEGANPQQKYAVVIDYICHINSEFNNNVAAIFELKSTISGFSQSNSQPVGVHSNRYKTEESEVKEAYFVQIL
jgi:hypothetical protein